MKGIEDITIREYFSRQNTDNYDVFLDILKPKNKFKGRVCKVNSLTFDEVEVIKRIFDKPTLEDIKDMFQTCYGLRDTYTTYADDDFYNTSIFDLFRAKRFLQNYITKIIKKENVHLYTGGDEKMMQVNASKRLAPWNHQLVKNILGQKYSCKPKEIGRWTYNEVFAIRASSKVYEDINREYNAIK